MTTSALHSLIFTVAFAIGTVLGTCAANPSSVAGPAKLVPGVASALVPGRAHEHAAVVARYGDRNLFTQGTSQVLARVDDEPFLEPRAIVSFECDLMIAQQNKGVIGSVHGFQGVLNSTTGFPAQQLVHQLDRALDRADEGVDVLGGVLGGKADADVSRSVGSQTDR